MRPLDGPDGRVLEVDHPLVRGTVHLHGAHLTSWAPIDVAPADDDRGRGAAAEQLWLSRDSSYGPGTAIRGGVPICFPWFAKGPGDREPQHGFARRVPWRFAGATDDTDGVTVRLRLADTDLAADVPGRDRWPYPFEAEYAVGLGRELSLDLTVRNTGSEPFPVGGALHTYLAVPDVARTSLTGLEGASYVDKVTGTDRRQQDAVTFDGETDRVYASTAPVLVRDGSTDRVRVHSSGASHTVVWNPGPSRAAAMADVPDDGWPRWVCVEAAVPYHDEVEVAPGDRWHLGQHITPASPPDRPTVGPGTSG